MKVSAHVLATMLDEVEEGVYHTDLDRSILHWNASAGRITGHSAATVVSSRCQDRIVRHVDGHGKELCSTARCPLLVALRTGKPHEAALYLHHHEGHLVPVRVRSRPFCNQDGALVGLTLLFRERTSGRHPREEATEDWKRAALTDTLTGLANRRAFRRAWSRAHRTLVARATGFGILMVDVDHFKRVNDVHGHVVGDRVLKMVARTLAGSVRDGDTVVRWGGEEFLLLVTKADLPALSDLAERVRKLVEKAWVPLVGGEHLSVTVSVGGALVRASEGPREVVERADAMLFACKTAGRNCSRIERDGETPDAG